MTTPDIQPGRFALAAALAVLALVALAGVARAQIPDRFTNLQVLPKDIPKAQLVETMRGFSSALGVRCTFCHVGEEGQPFDRWDLASDAKDHKRISRLMMQMTADLNSKYLAQIEHDDKPLATVTCATCHHGKPAPRTIQDVVARTIASRGVTAAIDQYRELRTKYYGRDAYDFGEQPLNALAENLADHGKPADAIAILQLNAEYHPRSAAVHGLLAGAHEQAHNRDAAIAAYKKVLELAPTDERAQRRLAELQGSGKR